jgi:hypothetical protein
MDYPSFKKCDGVCNSGYFGIVVIADGTNAATVTVKNNDTGAVLFSVVTKQPFVCMVPIWAGGTPNIGVTSSGTGAGYQLYEAIV